MSHNWHVADIVTDWPQKKQIYPDKLLNKPFLSCPNAFFQSIANGEAIDMKMILFILMQIKLFFTRKVKLYLHVQ